MLARLLLLCAFALGFAQLTIAQKKTAIDATIFYGNVAYTYLFNHDKYSENRKAELIIMILETDHAGKVTAVNLLADEKNHDISYSIISMITAEDFNKDSVIKKYANKVIVVPIFCDGFKSEVNYTNKLLSTLKVLSETKTVKEGKNYILTDNLYYAPVVIKDKSNFNSNY